MLKLDLIFQFRFSEISGKSEIPVEGESLPIPVSVLWARTYPKNIYKINEGTIAPMRRLNVRILVYLDDMLILASSKEEVIQARDTFEIWGFESI